MSPLQASFQLFVLCAVVACPDALAAASTVTLDHATVIGTTNGSVTTFSGIPFAEPPIGDLRLRLPQPILGYNGTINATQPATQCIQIHPGIREDMPVEMLQDMGAYLPAVTGTEPDVPQDEDCLSVTVQVPSGTPPDAKLPVSFYIYGGGFATGSSVKFLGDALVARSIAIKQPVIYVVFNDRLNTFGFLGGKEVKEASVGNLGLHDQRLALKWVNKYISAFGGDPEKVTIWGASAGAGSVSLQMVTNGGNDEGLFRGAVMLSGSPFPNGDITHVQNYYDIIVEQTGCKNSTDTLDCGLALPWSPHADGVFLKAPAQHLVLDGGVSNVPFITSDALDEGTIFASGSFNVTYLYPDDPAQGSPFGTGNDDQLAPMYKRMAAFQGDVVFQAPRRFFLEQRSSKQPAWSYISKHGAFKGLGVPHLSDSISPLFVPSEVTDFVIQFTATLDTNGIPNQTVQWPKYDSHRRQILTLVDGGLELGNDTLRLGAMAGLTALTLAYPPQVGHASGVSSGRHVFYNNEMI
ncbi:carotenoid ester lipase precursor [Lentinus brumalis]|uniref:Carboxylic ester hydrolase n=1 Tax=Lentinus brumalis TaxID=2498619 RepID=A0A371CM72_9APHY|nr:carotenoid ester lipase precursor [Polyporus brumalis]